MGMTHELLAPCGMNCALCYVHLREKKACEGCYGDPQKMPKHCMNCAIRGCEHRQGGASAFCFECDQFPCKRLKGFDKRYQKSYQISLIENLQDIQKGGVEGFLRVQEQAYTCPVCGGIVCVQYDACLACHPEAAQTKKKAEG